PRRRHRSAVQRSLRHRATDRICRAHPGRASRFTRSGPTPAGATDRTFRGRPAGPHRSRPAGSPGCPAFTPPWRIGGAGGSRTRGGGRLVGMIMAVSFTRYGRLYCLDPGGISPRVGDKVLVPTECGPEVAECVWPPQYVSEDIEGLPV